MAGNSFSLWFVGFALLPLPMWALAGGPQAPFTEEAQARGIVYTPNQEWTLVPFGDGVAFSDLDDDGDADIVVLGDASGVVGVYENNGLGYFTDRSADTGIGLLFSVSGITAGDYDNDGDLDLYISRWAQPNRLYRNDGGFAFVDVSQAAGVADAGKGTGCSWGDYDLDGFLDLAVSNREEANRLYRNLGDGTFQDVAVSLGVDQPADPAFQMSFFDYDRDRDPDLYIANDRGMLSCDRFHNYLFDNDNGNFVDVTTTSQTESCTDSMCIAIGDFDGNLYQDLYVTSQVLGNALLMNEGNGVFAQDEIPAGVISYAIAWGAVFFDYDNDGIQDLYVCNMTEPNRLYRHEGTWPCQDVGPAMGVADAGASFTVAAADIDADGDLDLLLSNREDPIRLFVNHEGQNRNWLKFDVVGLGSARWGIGTEVVLRTGTELQVREVIAGSNYKSQNHLVLHFGVGAAVLADRITVTWPGGVTRELSNLAANHTWRIFPPGKLGDADGDGDRDFDDFLIFRSCLGGGDSGQFLPGCEVMDFEGDGDVDPADFTHFGTVFDDPMADCNNNKMWDLQEIIDNGSLDLNANGLLDFCECLTDVDGDLTVGQADLNLVVAAWPGLGGAMDVDFDGRITVLDSLSVVGNFGDCP